MNILLLEDDPVLSSEISFYLRSKDIVCEIVYDGELFFRSLQSNTYDLFLLDINVPKMNGLDVCKKIRQVDSSTPIIMLTAYGQLEDKSDAFNSGADDYLVKPFHLDELYLRIQALQRRRKNPQTKTLNLEIEDLVIDLDNMVVLRSGNVIHLTPKEFKLLHLLAEANGKILSKQQIADHLWDYHIETNQNTIEVYINFLRNKIDKHHDRKLIHTKIGFGYYVK